MAERKPFALRLPSDLHEEVRRLAEAELRSVNSQIELLLREALRARGGGRSRSQKKSPDISS